MSIKQLDRLSQAKYYIDAYEASQKEAVVTSAPKEKEQAIAVRIPPRPTLPMPSRPMLPMPSADPKPALPSLPRRTGLRSLQPNKPKQLLLTQ